MFFLIKQALFAACSAMTAFSSFALDKTSLSPSIFLFSSDSFILALSALMQRKLRVLENGSGENAEPGAACRALAPRAPLVREPVEPHVGGRAVGADGKPSPFGEQALEGIGSVILSARPRGNRVPQPAEVLVGQAVNEGAQVDGIAHRTLLRHPVHRQNDHLPGCRQTKKKMVARAILFGEESVSAITDRRYSLSPHL